MRLGVTSLGTTISGYHDPCLLGSIHKAASSLRDHPDLRVKGLKSPPLAGEAPGALTAPTQRGWGDVSGQEGPSAAARAAERAGADGADGLRSSGQHPPQWKAIESISAMLSISSETLRPYGGRRSQWERSLDERERAHLQAQGYRVVSARSR